MIIQGNTVGTPMPRTDYEQTDPKKSDYLKGKEKLDQKIEKVQSDLEKALADTKEDLEGMAAKASPRNLLDNSYFKNPVNQLNRSGAYSGVAGKTTLFIDRWSTWSDLTRHTLTSDGIVSVNTYTESQGLMQDFRNPAEMLGKTYTLAICYDGGVIRSGKVTVPTTAGSSNHFLTAVSTTSGKAGCRLVVSADLSSIYFQQLIYKSENHTVEWVAMYEGDHTDNLPVYQPKGYEQELLVCRQYNPLNDDYVGLARFSYPANILHNSDFSNPINQRSQSSYTGIGYTIDRWRTWASGTITVGSGYIKTGSIALWQYIDPDMVDLEAYYTAVLYKPDGTKLVYSGKPIDGFGKHNATIWVSYEVTDSVKYPFFRIETGYTDNVKAVALYKGLFTEDSAPDYQQKGYGVELAECQRYYCNSWFGKNHYSQGQLLGTVWQENKSMDVPLRYPVALRIDEPTITLHNAYGREGLKVYNAGKYYDIGSYSIQYRLGRYGAYVRVSKGSADDSTWSNGATLQFHAHWEASADW